MTSGLPSVRPGAVAQPDQGLIDRIRRLEAIVEEQQRRDMNRATVGQGGTFRGYWDNGNLGFTFGQDIDDGVRKVRMNWPSTGGVAFQIGPGNPSANEPEQFKLVDQSGNNVFATDGIAGYGLAEPSLCYPAYAVPGLTYVAATPQQCTECQAFFYNAALWSQIRVRAFTGTITSVTGQLRLRHSDGTVVSSSTSAATASSGIISRVISVPEPFINSQFTYLEWMLTANGGGAVEVWPIQQRGVSRSYYNLRTDIQ